jgi:hypothetical protein
MVQRASMASTPARRREQTTIVPYRSSMSHHAFWGKPRDSSLFYMSHSSLSQVFQTCMCTEGEQ